MNILLVLTASLVAYLLGSVPVGLYLARSRGIDIQAVGSGNIGATNVARSLGRGWGILTFSLDLLKGFLPAFLFARLAGINPLWGLLFGLLAVLGHNFPLYLGFKGGKGIATSAGMLFGVAPLAVVSGLICWAVVFLLSRYVSLGSLVATLVVIISGWVFYSDDGIILPISLTALGSLAIWRHRTNIKRLLDGTESSF